MKLTNDTVIKEARTAGFDLVGFAKAEELNEEIKNLLEWLRRGYQAGMKYMERNLEKRENVNKVFPDAKSIISLAINYYTEENYSNEPNSGKISRYAWGKDYHLVVWDKLLVLENSLKELDPSFNSISYVDTGPVMDKVWAKKAGLGWFGKHTNLINKEYGSWIFLANIITNYEFNYSTEIEDFCGSCTACIDACPTQAIIEPYVVDGSKCISYLTIELKDNIPSEFKEQMDNWMFGCDVCQDVCPWNRFSKAHSEPLFNPHPELLSMTKKDWEEITEDTFRKVFKKSAVKRTKFSGLKRNIEFFKDKN